MPGPARVAHQPFHGLPLPPFPMPLQDPARVARERLLAGWVTLREAAVERMLADWVG